MPSSPSQKTYSTCGGTMVKFAFLAMISLFFSTSSAFAAAEWSHEKAEIVMDGLTYKKASVQISDGKIIFDSKKGGGAKKLSELANVQWQYQKGFGFLVAEDPKGNAFRLGVKKKEFPTLKAAVIHLIG